MSSKLAKCSVGRVLLHVICLLRDGRVGWHWAGIARELRHAQVLLVGVIGAAALLANPPAVKAAAHTWSGAVNGYWSVAGNWSAGGAPTNGESPLQLTFPANVMHYNLTNDVTGLQVDSLTLSGFQYKLYGLAGKNLTLKGGTNIVCTDQNTIDISLGLVLVNTNYISVATNAVLTLQSLISGTGSLAKIGPGELDFTGAAANTYGGATFVLGGNFMLQRGVSSNSPAVAVPGQIFVGSSNGGHALVTANWPQQLGGSQSVTMYKSGDLSFRAPQTIRSLTFNGGGSISGPGLVTLLCDVTADIPTSSAQITSPVSLGGTNRTMNVFDSSSYELQLYGSVSDGGNNAGIIKTGDGSLHLGESNSYAGLTIVTAGTLYVSHSWALGATSAGTIISNNAMLRLAGNIAVGAEPLTLNGFGFLGNGSIYEDIGANSWAGPVFLASDTRMDILNPAAKLTFSGPISGPGGLDKVGDGTLAFTGTSANSYGGATTLTLGRLELNKTNAIAVPGSLLVGDNVSPTNNATVQSLISDQIADNAAVTINKSGTLGFEVFNANAETIGSLAGSGNVNLVLTTLTTGGNNADTSFDGVISGFFSAKIVKAGSGTFTLNGLNTSIGPTVVNAGKLVVNGTLPGALQMNNLSFLGGTGVVGDVTTTLGHVAPGNSVGRITTGTLTINNGSSSLDVQLNGLAPGAGYDQIIANGAVNLTNATLNASLGFAGAVGAQYIVISNNSAGPVNGTFKGLAEGTNFNIGSALFQISYKGGDGNDIVLTQLSAITPPEFGGISKLGNGQIQLSGTGTPGKAYTVQANTNLNTTNWVDIGSAGAAQNGSLSFIDPDAPMFPMRFYRFKAQ